MLKAGSFCIASMPNLYSKTSVQVLLERIAEPCLNQLYNAIPLDLSVLAVQSFAMLPLV
jgi:hypothetical protein